MPGTAPNVTEAKCIFHSIIGIQYDKHTNIYRSDTTILRYHYIPVYRPPLCVHSLPDTLSKPPECKCVRVNSLCDQEKVNVFWFNQVDVGEGVQAMQTGMEATVQLRTYTWRRDTRTQVVSPYARVRIGTPQANYIHA